MNNNEPIVLGYVKKGKTGKPLLVLILFLFIGAMLFVLPIINSYFDGYNIIDLIKNGELISFIQNHDQYVDNKYIKDNVKITTTTSQKKYDNEPKIINRKSILEYNNFTIKEFDLNETSITYTIITSTNINFDKSNYYLILTKDNEKITIKLTGEINGSNTYTFRFAKSLSNSIDVKGIVKQIDSADYTNINLSTNEFGLAKLTCIKDTQSINYTFSNNSLTNINEVYKYSKNEEDYDNIYSEYLNISNNIKLLGGNSQITSNNNGFIIINNIDLNTYNYTLNTDYNYYSLNTQPKIVNFEMEAKGYDCK